MTKFGCLSRGGENNAWTTAAFQGCFVLICCKVMLLTYTLLLGAQWLTFRSISATIVSRIMLNTWRQASVVDHESFPLQSGTMYLRFSSHGPSTFDTQRDVDVGNTRAS